MSNEEDFNRQAKALLDDNVARLDASTLSKLHQARNRALQTNRHRLPVSAWLGAGAVAASLTVAVITYDQQPPQSPVAYQDPLPVLYENTLPALYENMLPALYEDPLQQAAAEDLELMDDLDFVAWLVLEEETFDNVDQST